MLAARRVLNSSLSPLVVSGSGAFSAFSASPTIRTATIPAPAGIVAGNLLLGVSYADTDLTDPLFQTPTGWALDAYYPGDGVNNGTAIAIFTRTATGSEPATYAFTANHCYRMLGVIGLFSGSSGLDGTPVTGSTGNSSTATVPSITSTGRGRLWVAATGAATDFSSPNPVGMINIAIAQIPGPAQDEIDLAYRTAPVGSGATGTTTQALSTGNRWTAASILVKP